MHYSLYSQLMHYSRRYHQPIYSMSDCQVMHCQSHAQSCPKSRTPLMQTCAFPKPFSTNSSQLQNKLSSSHAPSTHHASFPSCHATWCPYTLARLRPRGPVIYQHPAPSQARIHLRSLKRYSADSCPDTRAHCALLGSSRLQEGQPYRPPGAPLKIITDQVPGNPDPVPRSMTPLKVRVLPTCVLFNLNTAPDNQMSNNP